jgi:ECF sigma factor
MRKGSIEEVTELLQAWSDGSAEAGERLLPLVYEELRRQAARYLRRERRDHTLRPTALVHEAYLRLVGQRASTVTRDWRVAKAWLFRRIQQRDASPPLAPAAP